MTQDEIIEMARQAGVRDDENIFEFSQYKYLERFAKLVAAKAIAELESQEPSFNEWTSDYVRDNIHKLKAPPQRTEQNFCPRCGKRLGGIDSIHTCTPPMEKNT